MVRAADEAAYPPATAVAGRLEAIADPPAGG